MFDRKMFALAGAAFALFLCAAGPAFAQAGVEPGLVGEANDGDPYSDYSAPGRAIDPNRVSVTVDNNSGSRVPRQLRAERRMQELRRNGPHRESAVLATGSSAVLTAARGAVASAGVDCHVTEASNPGFVDDETPIYEAACADGPGYVLIASSPPQSYNCFDLAGSADAARARNPRADVGIQCELPANQNIVAVIGGWAREAGVTCQVNNAAVVGKSADNNPIYEIGCANNEGYWLEKAGADWLVEGCPENATGDQACRFTTASRN